MIRPFRRRPRSDDLMAVADAVREPAPRLDLDDVDVAIAWAELMFHLHRESCPPPPVIPGPRQSTEETS